MDNYAHQLEFYSKSRYGFNNFLKLWNPAGQDAELEDKYPLWHGLHRDMTSRID